MRGAYLVTDGRSEPVYAGFVAGLGWAHEQPQDRGVVEWLLRGLVGDDKQPEDLRADVFVSATTSAVVVSGPPELVESASARITRRLLGEEPLGPVPVSLPGSAAPDAAVLWRRWGAGSYGLLGLTPYSLQTPPSAALVETTLALFNAATVVPFGVDTDVMALLEHLLDGPQPPSPADDPVLPLPAHVVPATGPTVLSWVARPDERVADAVLTSALIPCFARPTPEQEAVVVMGRDLGSLGSHTMLQLVAREPLAEELSAVADQLRRLRDHGPTEAEIVQALDRLQSQPNESPLQAVMRLAWRRVTGVSETLLPEGSDVAGAVRSVLSRILVVAPAASALDDVAPERASLVDRARVSGRRFRAAKLTTAGAGLEGARLTVGAQGLSWRRARRRETIRAEDVAVIEVWDDGERSVLSRYGYRMHLDPLDWRHWDQLRAAADDLAPGRVRAVGSQHPGVAAALPERRFVDFARFAPYAIVALAVVVLLASLSAALNGDLPARDRVLAPLALLAVGAFLCHHMWSIRDSVRRRQRRARQQVRQPVPSGAAR